jgi:metal-sulfur cluster biosynthetic enzyme
VTFSKHNDRQNYSWTKESAGALSTPGDQPSVALTREAIIVALKRVMDPELNINIVDLGLVYDVTIQSKKVHVLMTVTSPKCPLTGHLVRGVRDVLFTISDVQEVHVKLTLNPPWTVERMAKEAREQLLGMKDAKQP